MSSRLFLIRSLVLVMVLPVPLQNSVEAYAYDDVKEDSNFTVTPILSPDRAKILIGVAGGSTAWIIHHKHLFWFDSQTNEFRSFPDEIKGWPRAFGAGSIWMLIPGKLTAIGRVDPKTGQVTATIPLELHTRHLNFLYMEFGEGALWLMDGERTLWRINPESNKIVARVPLGKGYWQPLRTGEGALWVMGEESHIIKRVDVGTNAVEEFSAGPSEHLGVFSFKIPTTYSLTVGGGALWVTTYKSGEGEFAISRLDPKTHQQVAVIKVPGRMPTTPAWWNGFLWVTSFREYAALKIDPRTNEVAGFVPLHPKFGKTPFGARGREPALLVPGEDSLWGFSDGLIYRIQTKNDGKLVQ
jgi:hypothetical protein